MATKKRVIIYNPIESAFTFMMKRQRERKNLGYTKLSNIIGMSKSYVANIEQGKYDTSMEIGFAICTALDIPVELFIDHMYQIKMERLLTDMETACNDWDIELPPQFRREHYV